MGVINMALRGLQFLWTLLVIAIVGDMIAEATSGNPSIINYVMFCAVFAMLSLFYLIPASIMDAFTFHPILPLALDVANSLFWFCAAVALSVQLGVHTCNNDAYTRRNRVINGSNDNHKRCIEAQALTTFLWFGLASFLASAVMSALGSRGQANTRPGIRRRGPAMSQV